MAILSFEQLEFKEGEDAIAITFLRRYHAGIRKEDLRAIGRFTVRKNTIEFFAPEKRAATRFTILLSNAFESLIGPNGRPTTYIHKNSGIPLIGTNDFGIIDRDTDVIEIKPFTGCNLNCTFCSVDEGVRSRKARDFLVEKDYLVSEFAGLAEKKRRKVEAHIAGQNEPTLYTELPGLIQDLARIPKVKETTVDTNGTMLTESCIAGLEKAGLSRIDLSLHALDPHLAAKLAGTAYNLGHVLSMARHIVKTRIRLLIAPVLLPGVNEGEIEKIILLSKDLGCLVGIQNFYAYEKGRRPVKELPMEDFEKLLLRWERKYGVDLHLKDAFSIAKDKVLEKPFHKEDKARVMVFSPGKYPGEVLSHGKGRIVTVYVTKDTRQPEVGETLAVKIVREKHNIFSAILA